MGKKKSGKKKSSKKKKGSGKGSSGGDEPTNHNGFTPAGEPIKVWCTDRLVPVEDTPANAMTRAVAKVVTTCIGELPPDAVVGDEHGLSDAGHRDLPHASFVRVGELHFKPVLELKKRINEATAWPIDEMLLLFVAKPEDGGRPIRDLVGWTPDWPWDPETHVLPLVDDLPLSSFGLLRKSKKRIAAEMFELEAHRMRMHNDPEYRREVQQKKLLAEEAKQAQKSQKKSSGKGKKGKGKGKGGKSGGSETKKMNEKDLAQHEAREKAKADKQMAELVIEQDKDRQWPENQVYLVLKAAGLPERAQASVFKPRSGLKPPERRPSTFLPPMPEQTTFHNSVAAHAREGEHINRAVTLQKFVEESNQKFSELPAIRGWPEPVPPGQGGEEGSTGGDVKKKKSSGKKKKSSGKKKKSSKKKKK